MNFNGMFGKLAPGMCRLSMNGGIAVKTENGYKSYNMKTGNLTNCDHFVFDIGEEFFFLIPTNDVKKGDIILANGKPKCVLDINDKTLTVINYETAAVETILPERHMFMGNTYFYGKIVSMFGDNVMGGKGTNQIMQYMMMSEMFKGKDSGMNSAIPMIMLMNNNGGNMFDGLFNFGTVVNDTENTDTTKNAV